MTAEEKDLHKEIKKNRWNNWFFQGLIIILLGLVIGHFWDAGKAYINDIPVRQAAEKLKAKRDTLLIAKVDTLIMFQRDHAHADHIRDSVEDLKWTADKVDKEALGTKIDGMQEVQISMLGTISSIQNRISNKNYWRECDE